MPKRVPLDERIRQNTSLPCKVDGCHLPRMRLGACCRKHTWRRREYGNPIGRRVFAYEYAVEKKMVSELIERNLDHRGIVSAIKFLDSWLRKAAFREKVPGQSEVERMSRAGVTGKDMLIECASIWVFSWWNSGIIPTDLPLTYALAIAAMTLVEREYFRAGQGKKHKKRVPGPLKKEMGEHIRNNLGVLFMNIKENVERQDDVRNNLLSAMRSPLI